MQWKKVDNSMIIGTLLLTEDFVVGNNFCIWKSHSLMSAVNITSIIRKKKNSLNFAVEFFIWQVIFFSLSLSTHTHIYI